jgi:hypothetical protein
VCSFVQHDKEKNYLCQLCEQKFGRAGHLKSHVLEKHEGISYKEQAKQAKQAKKKRGRK